MNENENLTFDITEQEKFILKKRAEGYKVHEIRILLANEGFAVPTRQTIYNILHRNGE